MRRTSEPASLHRDTLHGRPYSLEPSSSASSFTTSTPTPPPNSHHLNQSHSHSNSRHGDARNRHSHGHLPHAHLPHAHANAHGQADAHAPPPASFGPNPHILTAHHGHPPDRPHVREEGRWFSTPLPARLPYAVSYFLGHRRGAPQPPIHNLLTIGWAFIGIVISISVVALVTDKVALFRDNEAPVIVASFGAAAVLEFYSVTSPFAQPRNSILSQMIASTLGVSISKLIELGPPDKTHSIRWVGGALSCGIATAAMALTGTVHPPAGATALLAVVDDTSIRLGWYLIPLVLLSSCLMLVVALLVNNVQRQFPLYWWSPAKEKPAVIQGVRGAGGEAAAMEAGEIKRAAGA